MSVKDVFGSEVSKQNHMIIAHSPTSMLIEELRKRKKNHKMLEKTTKKLYNLKKPKKSQNTKKS